METIKNFLNDILSPFDAGYGNGDGNGDRFGSGYGNGYGNSSGSCYGYGYGYGSGSESGNGSRLGTGAGCGFSSDSGSGSVDGDGYGGGVGVGIKCFIDKPVYQIDSVPTIISAVFGNYAIGCILHSDLTTERCYVAKGAGGIYAHGATLAAAITALQNKLYEDMPVEDRINDFIACHKWGELYPANDLFEWHNRLTGSCQQGRTAFVKQHNIDMNKSYTVDFFIQQTKNEYQGYIIQKLEEAYNKINK